MRARFALTFGRGGKRHEMLARASEQELTCAINRPGVLFVCDRETEWLSRDGALLVGRLFDGARRLNELPSELVASLDITNHARSRSANWGNFLLFTFSKSGCSAYRDPSGAVPLYRCGLTEEAVFVSDAELALRLGFLDNCTADMTFARHWLQFPFLRSARTGVAQVSEVLPGSNVRLRADRSWESSSAWHPAPFVDRHAAITEPGEAARCLRKVVGEVIPLQFGADKIALQLSGGLDSSIIACAIAKVRRDCPCINFATASPEGDERNFAREVANGLGLELLEVGENRSAELKPPVLLSFRPGTNPLLLPVEEAVAKAAHKLGVELLVDGAGGDNLFCHLTSAAPVLDAFSRAGPSQGLRTIQDIALRADASWLEVLRAASKRLLKAPRWQDNGMFLRRDSLLDQADSHPWLEGLSNTPPGKRQHVEALVHIQHFLDRRESAIPLAHPLLAQPLLELCLRIPAWFWMQGGRDRAVARDAFADRLPPSVLKRRTKGSLQGLFYRSFTMLRVRILDLLMSGELRTARVIDSEAVEAMLGSDDPVPDDAQLRISEMLALELWLQSWKSPRAGSSTLP